MFQNTSAQNASGFNSTRVCGIFIALAFFICFAAAQTANAATFIVTELGDAGDGTCDATCTLRDAVAAANALGDADNIVFASPLFDTAQAIDLTSAVLTISTDLTITGTGARLLTVRRAIGNPTNFRIFNVGTFTVTISGLTISNGNATLFGGGIVNNGATLLLDGVTVSGNFSGDEGGGIYSDGALTILNSTISGNTSSVFGGGIRGNSGTIDIANTTISGNIAPDVAAFSPSGGVTFSLNNVTITNNTATNGAGSTGGVESFGTVVNLRNTIIAGNTAGGSTSPDVKGTFVSNGNNLIGDTTGSTGFGASGDKLNVAANLGALQDNGGQTDTHVAGINAVNSGNNCVVTATCPANNPPVPLTFDQRGAGFPRLIESTVDIGALEYQFTPTSASVTISGRVLISKNTGLRNAVVQLTDMYGNTRSSITSAFGYYSFDNVAVGETHFVSVRSKRYFFETQIINPTEDISDMNFFAQTPFGGLKVR